VACKANLQRLRWVSELYLVLSHAAIPLVWILINAGSCAPCGGLPFSRQADWAFARLPCWRTPRARRRIGTAGLPRRASRPKQLNDAQRELRSARIARDSAEATAAAARQALAAADARVAVASSSSWLPAPHGSAAPTRLTVARVRCLSRDGGGRAPWRASASELQVSGSPAWRSTPSLCGKGLDPIRMRLRSRPVQRRLDAASAEGAAMAAQLSAARAALLERDSSESRLLAETAVLRAARTAAEADAAEHQRKRLEARSELVSVAAALEAERRMSAAISSGLSTSVLPRLNALCDWLHNLSATLNPRRRAVVAADAEARAGGRGGGGGSSRGGGPAAAAAGEDFDDGLLDELGGGGRRRERRQPAGGRRPRTGRRRRRGGRRRRRRHRRRRLAGWGPLASMLLRTQ